LANILIAWEIGQNYGHVLPLLPVARALREAGHRVVFAVKDLRQVGKYIVDEGFDAIPAPAHPDTLLRPDMPQPESMSDILRMFGFEAPATLRLYLQAWRSLMILLGTDLVVASYAPTALLAARTLRLRTCWVGMPFELPPPITPCPPFRSWSRASPEALAKSEAAVVGGVNYVLKPHGLSIGSVFEIFNAGRQFLWTFPELDPEAERRQSARDPKPEYAGGIFTAALGEAPTWPTEGKGRIWGYLRYPAARMAPLVRALAGVDIAFCLVNPELRPIDADHLSSPNIKVLRQPVNLTTALSECDAVLNYGGHGTICASLLHGKPLVLVAEQMADASLARSVAGLGAALLPNPGVPSAVAEACQGILSVPEHKAAAERFRQKYRDYDVSQQAARLAEGISALARARAA
jgi:hypothetical protein